MLTPEQRKARAAAQRRYYWSHHDEYLAKLREKRAAESAIRREERLAARREYSAEWYQRQKVLHRAAVRRYRERHPDKYKAGYLANNRRRSESGLMADAHLRKKYGITLGEYEVRLAAQGDVCAICLRAETHIGRGGKVVLLSVDHDHVTGRIRGLLCRDCNQILGKFEDDPERFMAAARYLQTI